MIPYINVGYEYDRFGVMTEEYNMPRIIISKDRYRFFHKIVYKNIIFNNKYELRIWMDLNGYKIYRAYIYAEPIINKLAQNKCMLLLSKK